MRTLYLVDDAVAQPLLSQIQSQMGKIVGQEDQQTLGDLVSSFLQMRVPEKDQPLDTLRYQCHFAQLANGLPQIFPLLERLSHRVRLLLTTAQRYQEFLPYYDSRGRFVGMQLIR